MADLSEHFTHAEMACKDNCGYGQPHPRLMALLEAIRRHNGGKPFVPVSGLRCPPRNAAVEGATRSRHQSGEAADIPPGIIRPQDAVRLGARGVGVRDGWAVHVDVRRAKHAVIWTY